MVATTRVQVLSARRIPVNNRFKSILEVRCSDDTGTLSLTYFYSPPGMEKSFTPGKIILATGTIKMYRGQPQIVHPEITSKSEAVEENANTGTAGVEDYNTGRIVPLYTEIEGVNTRLLRKVLYEAVQRYTPELKEDLPEEDVRELGFPRSAEAIRFIHFPPNESEFSVDKLANFRTPSHCRLIYEEFFKFEYLILKQRMNATINQARSFELKTLKKHLDSFLPKLPFKLTNDQQKALKEIIDDLSKSHPMNRLVQGDVGSGKTAVTLLTAAALVAEGQQVTLMAPTEILAEQHMRTALKLIGAEFRVRMLLGKTTASERTKLFTELKEGVPCLVIGTHALLEDPVQFKNLSLVLIDEQHRFGVEQRRILRLKGTYTDPETGKLTEPHTLVLTATPIPRTLALTAYGDLSISTIKELPPGRSPITTRVVQESGRAQAYEKVRDQLRKGRQAYFIFPLVNDSEAEGFEELKSAVEEAERLAREEFKDFKVGLLHGKLKADEKQNVMDEFKAGRTHVLVSTTVVEVGVDVPNATVMAIEHAERFGLSQLHQLRGRVGRGTEASFCFLLTASRMASKEGSETKARLDILEKTQDGFEIAEADLEIRGPGEFLGTRQSGSLPFRMANLVRDKDWLLQARDRAINLLQTDADLMKSEHKALRAYYEREGTLQLGRLKAS